MPPGSNSPMFPGAGSDGTGSFAPGFGDGRAPNFHGFGHPGAFGHFGHGHFEHSGLMHAIAWASFGMLIAILVCVVALLALRLARRGKRGWKPGWPPGPPMMGPRFGSSDPYALLRLRYARGEISRDEFLRATEDLAAGEPGPPAAG